MLVDIRRTGARQPAGAMHPDAQMSAPARAASPGSGAGGRGRSAGGSAWNSAPSRTALHSRSSSESVSECLHAEAGS